jgi:ornithine cyclodeaminase/alanine dehydrogenase-like protein (mu-crystallin family)
VPLSTIGLDRIRAVATKDLVFSAVRTALIAHAHGRTMAPPPMHLEFPEVGGDCHVKAGYLAGSPHFVVKVATGFYRNPQRGLPSNNGLMLVIDAATGAPVATLADEGWLTAWRTAAAGALVTDALTPPEITEVGVLGTGLQALLQVLWLHELRPLTRVNVWGRRGEAAATLAKELRDAGIQADAVTAEEAAGSPCVIAATAATEPVAPVQAFRASHVTGIGTDMPGKNELPVELFAAATTIATDDHTQCLDHGDFGNAVRAGIVLPDTDTAAGLILDNRTNRAPGLSIADLTGVGAADAAVASAVLSATLA